MFGLVLLAAAAASTPQPCMAALPSPTDAQIAKGKAWYINAETIEVFGKKYRKYGLPRVLGPGEVKPAGDYRGVVVALPSKVPGNDIIYVVTDARCEFQPYVVEG
jgi:hypothetical protein